MDIRAFLAELGYTKEDQDAILADARATKAFEASAKRYDEGKAAQAQAQAEKQETQKFWEDKTVELQGVSTKMDALSKRAATAEAEAARRTTYLKSLKDQGFDVSDEMIGAAATTTTTTQQDPNTSRYVTQEDFDKRARATAPDLVSLTKISNEYQHLYGKPYLSIEEDFAEARKVGKPLTQYAREKYGFEAKTRELNQKAEDERIGKLVDERYKTKEAELAAKYGANPDLRSPMPSRFDKFISEKGADKKSWLTEDGRKANREARLKKYENVTLQ